MPPPNHRVNTTQETHSSLDSRLQPTEFVFNRGSEQNEEPCRVGAKSLDHLVRIDTVTQALRHRFPLVGPFDAISDHALRQQTLHWFIEINQTNVAHKLGPEPRINQVHDRMRISTDVLIHRCPVLHNVRIKRCAFVSWIAITEEVP